MTDDFVRGPAPPSSPAAAVGWARRWRACSPSGGATSRSRTTERRRRRRGRRRGRGAGRRAQAWPLDLVDEAATAAFLATPSRQFGGIHTLVHAAGPHVPQIHLSRVDRRSSASRSSKTSWRSSTSCSRRCPHLRERQGSIVAVTTAATRRYPVRDGLSSGPKGAVEAVVRAIAAEEGRFGVRANCVGPGMLTDGMAAAAHGVGRPRRRRARGDARATSRCAASATPSTSPRPCASSPPIAPTSSPARCSTSTAATASDSGDTHPHATGVTKPAMSWFADAGLLPSRASRSG